MADCNPFIGNNWKITEENGSNEVRDHKISISQTGGTFRVKCPNHQDYPDANCVNGELRAVDNSYTIKLTSLGPPKVIEHFPRSTTIGITPGSWTANDTGGVAGDD